MKKFIIANWKMNLGLAASLKLAAAIKNLNTTNEVVVCPAAFALSGVKEILRGSQIKLGAQNCFWASKGAYTGEMTADQLKELGCAYVIIGHSERRALGESCRQINQKITAALRVGLTPILCVGEDQAKRHGGRGRAFVAGQVRRALDGVRLGGRRLLIAYEPLWAIGSGRPAEASAAAAMQTFVKQTALRTLGQKASVAVLYGGSVDAANAAGFLQESAIDGLLIGGAGLQAQEFKKIANIK